MAPKNIVLFGATGMTGKVTLAQAVDAGYNVTVLALDPANLPANKKPSRVIEGNVLNKEDVWKSVEGQDAVIIVLGTNNDLGPTTVLSEGTRNIVEAMKKYGVRKVVACLSSLLLRDFAEVPSSFRPLTEDHIRMYQVLKDSGLDYVAVCPPYIADSKPFTGERVEARGGDVISTHDLSDFFLHCLNTSEYDGKKVTVFRDY